MRIAPLVLWTLASIIWLPWALLLLRLLVDLVQGTPLTRSSFFEPVLMPIGPSYGWSGWHLVSGFPIAALLGFALSALAWKLSWVLRDGLLRHGAAHIFISVLLPPLALYFAWQDARAELLERNAELEAAAAEALERFSAGQ